MPYITPSDLTQAFPDDALIAARIADDDQAVARAIADAESVIDSYVAAQCGLPLTSVPRILVVLACDLARYRLYDQAPHDVVSKRRDEAVATLRDIARGVIKLPDASGGQPAPAGDQVLSAGGRRVFDDSSLRGF